MDRLVRECAATFQKLLDRLGQHHDLRQSVADEFGRFRLWNSDFCAHSQGCGSLHSRLRDSSQLRICVTTLLQQLLQELRNELSLTDNVAPKDGNGAVATDDRSNHGSDSDAEGADDNELDNSSVSGTCENPDFDLLTRQCSSNRNTFNMAQVHEQLNCLMRLGPALRNPVRSDVIDFRSLSPGALASIQRIDVQAVRALFPKAEPELVTRLGAVISRHRQYISYRAHKRDPLEGERKATLLEQAMADHRLLEAELGTSQIAKLLQADVNRANPICEHSMHPSDIDHTGAMLLSNPSIGAQEAFECPLCFDIVIAADDISWYRHVREDLPPYVCLAVRCELAAQQFSQSQAWRSHLSQHEKRWLCPVKECSQISSSGDLFERHLLGSHGQLEHAERELLVKTCAQSSEIPLGCPACPLCGEEIWDAESWYGHVEDHLRRVSLLALSEPGSNRAARSGQTLKSEGSAHHRDEASNGAAKEAAKQQGNAIDSAQVYKARPAYIESEEEDAHAASVAQEQYEPRRLLSQSIDFRTSNAGEVRNVSRDHRNPPGDRSREYVPNPTRHAGSASSRDSGYVGSAQKSRVERPNVSAGRWSSSDRSLPTLFEDLNRQQILHEPWMNHNDRRETSLHPRVPSISQTHAGRQFEAGYASPIPHPYVPYVPAPILTGPYQPAPGQYPTYSYPPPYALPYNPYGMQTLASLQTTAQAQQNESAEALKLLKDMIKSHETERSAWRQVVLGREAADIVEYQPVHIIDAVKRKFIVPWATARDYENIHHLLQQEFKHVEVLGEHVAKRRYDLLRSGDGIISPLVWSSVIQPGWTIEMSMWPLPEEISYAQSSSGGRARAEGYKQRSVAGSLAIEGPQVQEPLPWDSSSSRASIVTSERKPKGRSLFKKMFSPPLKRFEELPD